MTVMGLLIAVLSIVVGGLLAAWAIKEFLPEPARMVAMAIVGVIILCALLYFFVPGIASHRVW